MINKLKVRIVPPVRNEEIDMQGRRTGAIEQYCKWVLRGNVPRSYIEKKDREFFGGQFWPPPPSGIPGYAPDTSDATGDAYDLTRACSNNNSKKLPQTYTVVWN